MKKRSILCGLTILSLFVISAMAIGGAPRVTNLDGKQEVNIGDPDGTGTAEIKLNFGQKQVCWELSYKDISNPTGAHIHKAPIGVNGPIVIPLSPIEKGCKESVDGDLIKDIIKNPEQYYVNIHNSDFPAGAIRGQLSNRGQSN